MYFNKMYTGNQKTTTKSNKTIVYENLKNDKVYNIQKYTKYKKIQNMNYENYIKYKIKI